MPLTIQPFAEIKELDTLREQLNTNVNFPERIGSVTGGAALVIYGAAQRSLGGLLLAVLGGALIHRGTTGRCELYSQLGIDSRQRKSEPGVRGNKGINVEKSVIVDRPPAQVFRYWRNLENLSRFMHHVESVRVINSRRSHWVVKGPAGTNVEWDAEIISEREGEFISWQSLPGAEVQNAGSVWFEPSGPKGTKVKVALQYQPPGGVLGAVVAKLFGEAPDQQLEEDLARFKHLLENDAAPAAKV